MKAEGELTFLYMIVTMIMGLLIITGAVKEGIQPFQNAAELSAMELQAKINAVCRGEQERWMEIKLPQTTADMSASGVSIGKNVIPRAVLSRAGDPNLLLYYEAFPPGEAVSWELYQDLGRRGILYNYNPDGGAVSGIQLETMQRNAIEKIRYSSAVFGNVVLKDREKDGFNLIGDIGEWNKEGTQYVFDRYEILSPLNKTAVKYRVCGVNALCLKSTSGIKVYPLDDCADSGVNHVQLTTYQPMFRETKALSKSLLAFVMAVPFVSVSGRIAIATAANVPRILSVAKAIKAFKKLRQGYGIFKGTGKALVVSGVAVEAAYASDASGFTQALNIVSSAEGNTDFYLASPCTARVKIEKTECSCWDNFPNIIGLIPSGSTAVDIQQWELEGDGDKYTAKLAGQSTKCRNRMLRTSKLEVPDDPAAISNEVAEIESKVNPIGQCIRITVEEHDGFCYSKFSGQEGRSEYPLYQSASLLGAGAYHNIITLEGSDAFEKPQGVFETEALGAAGYSWP